MWRVSFLISFLLSVCDVYTTPGFVPDLTLSYYTCDGTQVAGTHGFKTILREFPHMGSLGWTSGNAIKWLCGTFLISLHYTLTAAHCSHWNGVQPDVIRLGEYNLNDEYDGADPVDFEIEQFIKHPQYRPRYKYHDIALVKFDNDM